MIVDVERRCGLSIPTDVRDHLLNIPLTGEGIDGGGELVLFWSAAQVKTVAEQFPPPQSPGNWRHPGRAENYLIFCDYLVSCWEWAVVCEPGPEYGRIALLAGEDDDLFLYKSFAEMVDDYVNLGDFDFALRGIATRKAP